MLHHKSRSACGEIIHVRQILAELPSLILKIFTHFSLSSQLLLHPCMDLNEIWQGCCNTRSACGEIIHVRQILAELWSLTLRIFTNFSQILACLPNSSYILAWMLGMLHHKSRSAWGEIIHVRQILAELWSLTLMFYKFWQSYGPWHLEFLHILACLLNFSYILAWIWIKLGRDVAPQV